MIKKRQDEIDEEKSLKRNWQCILHMVEEIKLV